MQKTLRFFLTLSISLFVFNAYAEANKPVAAPTPTSLSLYQQPDTKSPVVGSIPANQPIMPIFTQGQWTKIADPSNGNVGWVSNDTLKQQGIPYTKIITQSLNGPNQTGSKTVEYMGPVPVNEQQMSEAMKKWQTQRNQIQSRFNQILQQNIKALDALSKEIQDPDFQFPMVIPVLQPVVVMPNKPLDKMVVPAEAK